MKSIAVVFGSVMLMCSTLCGFAQVPDNSLKARLFHAKLLQMQSSMELTAEQMEPFTAIYSRYEAAIAAASSGSRLHAQWLKSETLTADQADEIMSTRFANAKRLIAIREDYLLDFKEVLSPRQLIKFYQTETEIRNKIRREFKNRQL